MVVETEVDEEVVSDDEEVSVADVAVVDVVASVVELVDELSLDDVDDEVVSD